MRLSRLTPAMRDFFEQYYCVRTKAEFARMFNEQFGLSMTRTALKYWARKIGVAGESPAGYMTVAEICSITGDAPASIFQLIRSGKLKAVKPGGFQLIPLSAAERFISSRQEPDWPWITLTEARKMLGYTRNTLADAIRRGSIPGKLLPVNGHRQWVVPERLMRMAHERIRLTGNNRTPWEQLTNEWSERYHVDF